MTLWTVSCQALLSMGFPRLEYWRELPFSSADDLPDAGIKPMSPALQADSLPLSHQGNPLYPQNLIYFKTIKCVPDFHWWIMEPLISVCLEVPQWIIK